MSIFDPERVYAEVQEAIEHLFAVVASADIVSTMALMTDALHADQGTLQHPLPERVFQRQVPDA